MALPLGVRQVDAIRSSGHETWFRKWHEVKVPYRLPSHGDNEVHHRQGEVCLTEV